MKTIQISDEAFDLLEGAVEEFLENVLLVQDEAGNEEWLGQYRTEGVEMVEALNMVQKSFWLDKMK